MKEIFQNIGFSNGIYSKVSEIKVPIENLAIGRGYAAYEFFRINNGKPFYLDRHLERFFNSLNYLKFGIEYSRDNVIDIVNQIITLNEIPNFYLKIYAIPQNTLSHSIAAWFYIVPAQIPLFDNGIYLNGGSLIMKEYQRFLPEAKSNNYIASVFWQSEMDEVKAIDVLFIWNNQVFESSRGNIFIVKQGIIYTPAKNILKGITRSIVLDLLQKYNMPYEIKDISVDELFNADEVFLTSTVKRIMPIVKISNKIIKDGKPGIISLRISEMYNNLFLK
jgi:branched-subunit amino acid aminotransferase/4-amino-4-deoxychorismate lyase